VALAAVSRESQGLMVRILSGLKRLQVTADTFCRESLAIELPDSTDFVAGVTIRDGVGSEQWKAILVLIDVVN
jgi:hypothetical protein